MNHPLPDFDTCRVLVIGDLMLDRYWTGSTGRISPEAPVPVVKVDKQHDRLGGAANVAVNLATLGCSTALLGMVGDDENATALTHLAISAGLDCHFVTTTAAPTITKLRIISRHQQLLRLDFENSYHDLDKSELHALFGRQIDGCNAIILSDYGKGGLSQCQHLIKIAREKGIPVLVDPKGSDFDRYQNATIITPNLSEFEQVMGSSTSDQELFTKAEQLRTNLNLQALLITLGERGMALIEKDSTPLLVPTRAKEVYDVTGAGDTVIATLGACISANIALPLATRIANVAAGIAVGKLGTATVDKDELNGALSAPDEHSQQTLVTQQQLAACVANAKQQGDRIVLTNGCFDLLHPGHLSYLKQARELGDRLIVAVNSDESVTRLKGHERPINALADRMQMLAGLDCVDWVCAFSEDTPRDLIAALLPDVLVKGGDYKVEDVAGHEEVLAAGGRVEILGFLPGYSSTGLIEKIKRHSK